MSTSTGYDRPKSAKLHYSFEKFNLSGTDFAKPGTVVPRTVDQTNLQATTNRLYNDVYFADEILTSGLIEEFGGVVAILTEDTKDLDTGRYATELAITYQLNTGDTPIPGDKLYWDPVNEEFTTTASTHTLCGRALSVARVLTAGNTENLYSATFVDLYLHTPTNL